MKLKDFLGTTQAMVGVLVLCISTILGGFFYLDERFAHADEVKKLEQRVTLNELTTLYKDALDNLYFYRKQNRKYPDDDELKKKLTEAEGEVKDLKKLLDEAKKKKLEKK